jgi:hypothetical protein
VVAAQAPVWSVPSYGLYPGATAGAVGPAGPLAFAPQAGALANRAPSGAATRAPQQAPLARVVRNPDESSGLPPYALTDNAGTIQRYVEPVPGVDLVPYVGTVVRVRHDTGRTLLASQLELPPQPLRPLVGSLSGEELRGSVADVAEPIKLIARPAKRGKVVRPAEFVDDDDATVQLLADAEEMLPDGGEISTPPSSGDAMQAGPTDAESSYPTSPDGMPMEGGQMYGEPLEMGAGPLEMDGPNMDMGLPGMEYGAGLEGPMEVCPQCGGYHLPPGYDESHGEGWGPACRCHRPRTRFYADVQINFLRAHVMENFAGKLSEQYEFSPRVIVGFDGTGTVDGRARYWHYGRDTQVLDGGGSVRIDFDVVDIEVTRTVPLGDSAFLLAAGLRTANIELGDDDGDTAGCDLLGLTLAADFHTLLCQAKRGEFVGVCGARLSILGGDWGQDGGSDFIPSQLQDDNWVVDELYAGIAYETCYRTLDLHAQLGFEMQNWHSDALAQFAGADSISFLGPGIEIGAEF